MIPQRQQQPAYDPMAQMMQILQFALQQNQQGQQQANQDRSFGLEQQQLDMRGQQFDQQQMQQIAAQQADQEYRNQQLGLSQQQMEQQAMLASLDRAMQSAQQNRMFGLDQQKLDMGVQQFNQQTLQQQEQQKQQQQQAIMMALSRAMPQNANGFDDPTVLYQYLQQQGIQLPGMQPQQPVVDPQKAAAQAMMQKLGQQ